MSVGVLLRRVASWIVVTVACLFAAFAAAAPAALVIDVEGGATVAGRDLRLLGELAPDSEITLADDGRTVLLYLADGTEYSLTGPGRYRVTANRPQPGAGAAPAVRRASPVRGRDTRLRTDRVGQGGQVMRGTAGATLLRPTDELVVDSPVVFAWQAWGDGTTYRLDVVDAAGNSLLAVETVATEYRMEAKGLRAGASYRWSIRGSHAATREPFYAASQFRVATEAVRRELAALRPSPAAEFAQQVRYVALLERLGARSEALAMREALAGRRVAAWAPPR